MGADAANLPAFERPKDKCIPDIVPLLVFENVSQEITMTMSALVDLKISTYRGPIFSLSLLSASSCTASDGNST